MRYESIAQMAQRNHRDKEKGVQHTPLHTLQECCEEAGVTPIWFGRYAAQYPDAPQPIISTQQTPWRAKKKYYRKHEFVRWVNQVRQQQSQSKQKEKIMPDLKSELTKVINAWEHTAPEPEPMPETRPSKSPIFEPTNNVCRNTFDCIKKNPGKSRKEIIEALLESGYKKGSTTSLIGQMVKQGMVRDTGGLLYAVTDEYVPLKSHKAWVRQQALQQVQTQPQPKPAPERKHITLVSKRTGEVLNPKPVEKEWSPDDVISKLNVHQALALFKALRNILVG